MRARLAATFLGLVAALLLVEGALRLAGFVYLRRMDARNDAMIVGTGEIRVLCVGESTTAFGGDRSYPVILGEILNASGGGRRFVTFNRGVPASDSSVLVPQTEQDLDKYAPHVVVAMMGANDDVPRASGRPIPLGYPRRTVFFEYFRVWRLARLAWYGHTRKRQVGEALVRVFRWQDPGICGVSDSPPTCRIVARAWDQVRSGDPAGAEVLLRRAGDPVALLELALLQANQEHLQEAERTFGEAAVEGPHQARARIELGGFLFGQRRLPEALTAFEEALALDPESIEAWLGVGYVAYMQSRMGEALEALGHAPLDGRALLLSGAVQARLVHDAPALASIRAGVARYRQPKVVVSTNVAETSLTIDGVRLVIDCGLARIPRYDAYRGINTLFVE